MKTYNINTMSRIFGIPKSTLRYWESEDLIHLHRNQENNYREFSVVTMLEIIDTITYRMMNIPVKEIRNIAHGNKENLKHLLQEKEEQLEEQIVQLQTTLAMIKHKQQHIRTFETLMEEPYTQGRPSMSYIVPFEFEDQNTWKMCQEDCAHFAIYLENESNPPMTALATGEKPKNGECYWEDKDEDKKYVQCILKVAYNDIKDNNLQVHIERLKKRGITPGNIIAHLLFTANEEKYYDYYHTWIQVK